MQRLGRAIAEILRRVGRGAVAFLVHLGQMATMLKQIAVSVVQRRIALGDCMTQAFEMGVRSLGLVVLTAVLAGVVTSQQGGYQFTGSVPLYVLGSIVTSSVILELGPVMTAFVMIGRVGARITAELGTMQVSEQVDALLSLGRDPVRTLAAPRILAGIIVMPLLVGIADCVGVIAGMLAARSTLGLGSEAFLYGARLYWHSWDLFYSILKGVAFGFIVPLVAVHMGLLTRGGAQGVGRATTTSVVVMIIAVLAVDALFPPLLLG